MPIDWERIDRMAIENAGNEAGEQLRVRDDLPVLTIGSSASSTPESSSLERGWGGILSSYGRAFGSKGLEQYGTEMVQRNPAQTENWRDIFTSPGTYVKEALGETAPQLGLQLGGTVGGSLLGAGVGGLLGGPPGALIGSRVLGFLGGMAPTVPMLYGGTLQRQEAEGLPEDKGAAITSALLQGGVEQLAGVQRFVTKAGTGALKTAATKGTKEYLKAVGKEGLKQSFYEGLEEVPQEYIDVGIGLGRNPFTAETAEDAASAFLRAGIGTLPFGGGAAIINQNAVNRKAREDAAKKPTPTPDQKALIDEQAQWDADKKAARTAYVNSARNKMWLDSPDVVGDLRATMPEFGVVTPGKQPGLLYKYIKPDTPFETVDTLASLVLGEKTDINPDGVAYPLDVAVKAISLQEKRALLEQKNNAGALKKLAEVNAKIAELDKKRADITKPSHKAVAEPLRNLRDHMSNYRKMAAERNVGVPEENAARKQAEIDAAYKATQADRFAAPNAVVAQPTPVSATAAASVARDAQTAQGRVEDTSAPVIDRTPSAVYKTVLERTSDPALAAQTARDYKEGRITFEEVRAIWTGQAAEGNVPATTNPLITGGQPQTQMPNALQAQEAKLREGARRAEAGARLKENTTPEEILVSNYNQLTKDEKQQKKDVLAELAKREGLSVRAQDIGAVASKSEEALRKYVDNFKGEPNARYELARATLDELTARREQERRNAEEVQRAQAAQALAKKETQDAIQEQATGQVDVRQQTQNGEEVGQGNAQPQKVAEAREAKRQVASQVTREQVNTLVDEFFTGENASKKAIGGLITGLKKLKALTTEQAQAILKAAKRSDTDLADIRDDLKEYTETTLTNTEREVEIYRGRILDLVGINIQGRTGRPLFRDNETVRTGIFSRIRDAKSLASLEALENELLGPTYDLQRPGVVAALNSTVASMRKITPTEQDVADAQKYRSREKAERHGESLSYGPTTSRWTQEQAVDIMNGIMREITQALGIDKVGDIDVRIPGVIDYKGEKIAGTFYRWWDGSRFKALITVALDGRMPVSTAAHEALHALEDMGMLSPSELKIITNAFKKNTELRKRLDVLVSQYDERAYRALSNPKELRAYAYQFWRTGQLDAKGTVEKIFSKIRNTLERIGNKLKGLGYTSADDVFNSIAQGKVAERKIGLYGFPGSTRTVEPSLAVDGTFIERRKAQLSEALKQQQDLFNAAQAWADEVLGFDVKYDLKDRVKMYEDIVNAAELFGVQIPEWIDALAPESNARAKADANRATWESLENRAVDEARYLAADLLDANTVKVEKVEKLLKLTPLGVSNLEDAGFEADTESTLRDMKRYMETLAKVAAGEQLTNAFTMPIPAVELPGLVMTYADYVSAASRALDSFFEYVSDIRKSMNLRSQYRRTIAKEIDSVLNNVKTLAGDSKTLFDAATNKPPKFRTDNPGGRWLAFERQNAAEKGVDEFGAPRVFGSVTGYFTDTLLIPVDKLVDVPGRRSEQKNVRPSSLKWLTEKMRKTGKLPLSESGKEMAPFIQVDQNGQPWVNEGNHRIMAAKELGWKSMPVEVKYFNGGEDTAINGWSPNELLAQAGDSETLFDAASATNEDIEGTAENIQQLMKQNKLDEFPPATKLFGATAKNAFSSLKDWYLRNGATSLNLSKLSDGFAGVFEAIFERRSAADQFVASVRSVMPNWFTGDYPRKTDPEIIAVSEVDLAARRAGKVFANAAEMADAVTIPSELDINSVFEMYRQFRKGVERSLIIEAMAYKAQIADRFGRDSEVYEDLAKRKDDQVTLAIERNYTPARRYGEYAVPVYLKGTRQVVAFMQAESRARAELIREDVEAFVKEQGIDAEVDVGGVSNLKPAEAQSYSQLTFFDFLDILDRHKITIDRNQMESIVRTLVRADELTRNRYMQWQDVPGQTTNFSRVAAEFVVHNATRAANLMYGGRIRDARSGYALSDAEAARLADLNTEFEGKDDISLKMSLLEKISSHNNDAYDPAAELQLLDYLEWRRLRNKPQLQEGETTIWDRDGTRAGLFMEAANDLMDFVQSHRASPTATALRTGASLMFLGMNISAGVVQLMSTPLVTIPTLSQHVSRGEATAIASKYLAMATPLVMKSEFRSIMENISSKGGSSSFLQNPELLDEAVKGLGLSDEQVKFLRQALEDGTVSESQVYGIFGEASGSIRLTSASARKALDVWMSPFRATEQINRVTALLAGYDVGKQLGKQGEDLYKFARDIVRQTQGVYGSLNLPGAARSTAGQILMTFRLYPIMMTELIVRMGVYGGPAGKSAAATMLFMLWAAAGIGGLPGEEDIEDIIDTIATRIFGQPFNSRRALRNHLKTASEAITGVDLSNVLLHGMLNSTLNIDFASRLSLSNLVPGTGIMKPGASIGQNVTEILGPVMSEVQAIGGAAAGAAKAGVQLAQGSPDVAWDTFMRDSVKAGAPVAIRNILKGASELESGEMADTRGRVVAPVTTTQALLHMGGFAPSQQRDVYDWQRSTNEVAAFGREYKQELQDSIVRAIRDGDTAKAQAIFEFVSEYNKANPSMPLVITSKSVRRAVQNANIPLNERTLKTLPKAWRGTFRDELEGIESGDEMMVDE